VFALNVMMIFNYGNDFELFAKMDGYFGAVYT
jgi:hypothetical protein